MSIIPEVTYSILLAHPDDDRRGELAKMLEHLGHSIVDQVPTVSALVGAATRTAPDVIVTAVRFGEEIATDGLLEIARVEPRPAILVTTRAGLQEVEAALEDHVMAFLIEPVDASDLRPTLYLVRERFREFEELRGQVETLQNALEARKIIERAKGRLMETRGLTEGDAYRALQKLANDQRRRLVEVAEAVLIAAELETETP